jgi:hypothetical protein
MSAHKFKALKRKHRSSDALLVAVGVIVSIIVVGFAGRSSSVLPTSPLDSLFKSRQPVDVLEQSPDLATALSRLKKSHGKYCDQAVSACESCILC